MSRIRPLPVPALYLTLVCWLGIGGPAIGVDLPWGASQQLAVATDGVGLARADLDGDGALDLLSFGPSGLLWIHGGSTTTLDGTLTDLQTVAAADLDQDGDLDVVGGSQASGLVWWENANGDGSTWVDGTLAGSLDIRHLVIADLDADGDPDVVAALGSGSVEWWSNGGAGTFTRTAIDAAYADASSVAVADLDGDGDLDVVATADGGSDLVSWWRNDGASWTERTVDSGRSDPTSVRVADLNQDGHLDLAAVDAAGVQIWSSDGTPDDGGWTRAEQALAGLDRLDGVDLDLDGDLDLLSSAGDAIRWWENLGDGTWTARTGPTVNGARGAIAYPADGDGDWDVAAASHTDDDIQGFANLSLARSTTFTEQGLDNAFDGARSVSAADLDGDGDMDVIGAAYDQGEITWWRHDGGDPIAWTRSVVDSQLPYAFAVRAVDLDADGDLDILAAISRENFQNGTNRLYWWRNDGGDPITWTRQTVASPFGASDVWPVDMDLDGDVDLLSAAAGSDEVAWYENNGSAGGWSLTVIDTSFGRVHSAVAADIDGDGDPDVAAVADTGDEVAWFENTNGDGSAWTQHTVQSSWDGAYDVWVGDIDGDGALDIVAASQFDDRISWWRNTDGEGTFGSENTLGDPLLSAEGFFNQAYSVETADMDGDGTLDIVGTAFKDGGFGQPEAGMVAWWSNTMGDGSTWQKHEVTRTYDGASSVHVADVNGDGLPDLLTTAQGLPVFPRAGAARKNTGGDRITLWRGGGGQAALIATSTAPADPSASSTFSVFEIEAAHRGALGEADIELASLALQLTEADDTPLSTVQANALIERLRLFRDAEMSGTPGSLDLATDSEVAVLETLALDGDGVLELTIADGAAEAAVGPAETALFFVVLDTTAGYESEPLAGFKITLRQALSRVEDRDADTELRLEYQADVDTGTMAVGDLVDLQVGLVGAPDPVEAGQAVTWTATVQNAGPSTAGAVTLTWTLPTGISSPTTSGCAEDPAGTVTCSVGSLAPSASTMVTLSATVDSDASGSLTASVTASSNGVDGNLADNEDGAAVDVTSLADLNLQISGPAAYTPSVEATILLQVANAGPGPASATVVPTLPSGLELISASCRILGGGASCGSPPPAGSAVVTATLPAGGSVEIELTVRPAVDATGILTVGATVTTGADATDGNTSDNSDSLLLWPPDQTIFVDGFESGSTSAWSP